MIPLVVEVEKPPEKDIPVRMSPVEINTTRSCCCSSVVVLFFLRHRLIVGLELL